MKERKNYDIIMAQRYYYFEHSFNIVHFYLSINLPLQAKKSH